MQGNMGDIDGRRTHILEFLLELKETILDFFFDIFRKLLLRTDEFWVLGMDWLINQLAFSWLEWLVKLVYWLVRHGHLLVLLYHLGCQWCDTVDCGTCGVHLGVHAKLGFGIAPVGHIVWWVLGWMTTDHLIIQVTWVEDLTTIGMHILVYLKVRLLRHKVVIDMLYCLGDLVWPWTHAHLDGLLLTMTDGHELLWFCLIWVRGHSSLFTSHLCWRELVGHLEDWLILLVQPFGWLHGFTVRLGSSVGIVTLIKCCCMHTFGLLDVHVLVIRSSFQI